MQALEKLAIKNQFSDENNLDQSTEDNYDEFNDSRTVKEYDDRIYLLNKRRLEAAYAISTSLPAYEYYAATDEGRELRIRFSRLYSQWKAETKGVTSIQKIVLNPNYLKIIGMGEPAIPFILNSLAQKPDHWFVALSALTDDVPTSPGDNLTGAVAKWLNWGVSKGYLQL